MKNKALTRVKYLCLLGHRQNPTPIQYGDWQSSIIDKYHLFAFSYITNEQIEAEIKIMEK